MDLTIVIVNWNGGELLQRCLQSIRASHTSFTVKVIVVDNDSQDGSREQAQRDFPEFHIFNSGSNLGFGKANNLARPITDTPLVLFLNPDTELKPDTLEKSVQCLLEHPNVGALGCKMLYLDGTVQQQGIQWHLTPWRVFVEMMLVTRDTPRRFARWLPTLDPNDSSYVCKLYGGFVLVHREVLDHAGWFDERYFMYAEDGDLSRTILTLGWKLFYTAEAEITHVVGGTSDKAPSGFSVLMKHESIGLMMHKYCGWRGALGYRLAVFSGATLRLLMLSLLNLVAARRYAKGSRRYHTSVFKHKLMLLWALGLRSAESRLDQRTRTSMQSRAPCSHCS
jgi:hypothetical protein